MNLPAISPTNRIPYPSTAKCERIMVQDLDHLTTCSNEKDPFKNINVAVQASHNNTPDPTAHQHHQLDGNNNNIEFNCDKRLILRRLTYLKESLEQHDPVLTKQRQRENAEMKKSKRIWELWKQDTAKGQDAKSVAKQYEMKNKSVSQSYDFDQMLQKTDGVKPGSFALSSKPSIHKSIDTHNISTGQSEMIST